MRLRHYDSLKFLAVLIVFTTHFIFYYNTGLARLWSDYPYCLIFKGITGKFAVALLGIIMCRFAYCSGAERRYGISEYIIRRYFYFVLYGLVINAFYLVFLPTDVKLLAFGIPHLLRTSLALSADIFSTFWCIRPFFLASVMAYIIGFLKKGDKWIEFILIITFLICGHIWVAVCLMGTLVPFIEENRDKWCRKWSKYLLIILFFLSVYRNENDFGFFMWGISSIILLMLTESSGALKKALDQSFIHDFGKYTMAVFIIHIPVYQLAGGWLLGVMNTIPYKISITLCYIVCLILTILISIPLTYILDLIYKKITRLCHDHMRKTDSCIKRKGEI